LGVYGRSYPRLTPWANGNVAAPRLDVGQRQAWLEVRH
jgi:hypothetical protein